MKLETLNSWLALLAHIGVIGGIIFLGVEVSQNTAALQASSREAALDNSLTALFRVFDDPAPFLTVNDPNISEEDRLRLTTFYLALMERAQTMWLQRQAGALDEQTLQRFLEGPLRSNLSNPIGRQFWERSSKESFDIGLVNEIDRILAERN